jgi:hypothetical protein
MAKNQNLHILNTNPLCTGVTTRHRKTVSGEEKSVIDFILVCDGLKAHFEYMVIDEDRIHVLKKYCTRKGIRNEIESDHNVQYAKFNLKYQEIRCRTKREIFNFKNTECQQKFYEVTQNTHKLSSCFRPGENFLDQSSKFFKTLDGTFHQCFKKIRIKNKTMNVNKKDDIQLSLELKTKLQMCLNESKSEFSREFIKKRLAEVTDNILLLSSTRNKKIIDEHFHQLNNLDGTFSRIDMWKLKSKLLPNKYDPPTAKKDGAGNLITAVEPLKKLYLSTYIHRLRHRPIREDLQDLFLLKHKLWEGRLTLLKSNVAKPWMEEDLDRVIKSLKNNQTRDP